MKSTTITEHLSSRKVFFIFDEFEDLQYKAFSEHVLLSDSTPTHRLNSDTLQKHLYVFPN